MKHLLQAVSLAASLLSVGLAVAAPQLSVTRSGDRIIAQVDRLDYPENFEKDLSSGLTTHLLVQLVLKQADSKGIVVAKETYAIETRYDLWDEVYSRSQSSSSTPSFATHFKTLEQVTQSLRTLSLPTAFSAKKLSPDKSYEIEANFLLNPIEKERVQKIRKWVAQNSVAARHNPGTGMQASPTRFNEVFVEIFEQYTQGQSQIALWQRSAASSPFFVKELKNEKP